MQRLDCASKLEPVIVWGGGAGSFALDTFQVAMKFQKFLKEKNTQFYLPCEVGMKFADTDVPRLAGVDSKPLVGMLLV